MKLVTDREASNARDPAGARWQPIVRRPRFSRRPPPTRRDTRALSLASQSAPTHRVGWSVLSRVPSVSLGSVSLVLPRSSDQTFETRARDAICKPTHGIGVALTLTVGQQLRRQRGDRRKVATRGRPASASVTRNRRGWCRARGSDAVGGRKSHQGSPSVADDLCGRCNLGSGGAGEQRRLAVHGAPPTGRLRRELWCLAHAMTVAAAAVALWHRAHIYKALACVVLALIGVQYLLSGGVLDRRSIETIFTINATRYADRSYRTTHQRGLIIYGPATVPSLLANASSTTTVSSIPAKGVSNSSRSEPAPTRNLASGGAARELANNATNDATTMPRCPLIPPNLLGPVVVSKLPPPSLSEMERSFVQVRAGGTARPANCVARHRVAVIIPFRDRLQHLQALLYNLHPILLRQQIDYQIFVIEQEGSGPFNRAMLMNVGYVEALRERTFDCFIFHDVDLLPEDDRNLYTCPEQPRHMSVAVDKFKYRLPYADLFGGVSAMSREHFQLVNGFSNVFWGWGGEDDDMANRIKAHGLHISRYPANVARYKMLLHKKEKANPKRYEFLKTGKKRFSTDGLTNLQYELIDKRKPKLYTWLLVRLTPPQPS